MTSMTDLCEQTLPVMEPASASIRAALPQAREVRMPAALDAFLSG
jgi:hypothetical protein